MTSILRQSTAVDVLIGPFIDLTNGYGAETGESPSVSLSKNGQALATKNDVTTPVHDANGYYNCELDATDTNTIGTLVLVVPASANAREIRHEYQIVEEKVYDTLFASGGDLPSPTAIGNLEDMYDGTGYVTDTAPASRAQVDALVGGASGTGFGATVSDSNADGTDPLNGVTFVGTVSSGSSANLATADGTGITITHDTNVIDVVFQFNIPVNALPQTTIFDGYLQSSNDLALVQIYDHDGASWVTTATLNGQNGTGNNALEFPMGEDRFSSSAGIVYVRIRSTATNNQILFIDRLVTYYINQTVGYANGAIWIDTNESNTNTTKFVDGVADNPVSTLAAGLTLASSVGLKKLTFATGSSITLANAFNNYVVDGENVSIALGGQDIGGCILKKLGLVIGVGVNSSGPPPIFDTGPIGNVTLPPCVIINCGFTGTMTIGSTGDYLVANCHSQVAGSSSPIFDFNSTGGVNFSIRKWSGGISLANITTGDIISVDVISGGNVTISGDGGSVFVRGLIEGIIDNSDGAVTIDTDGTIYQANAYVGDIYKVHGLDTANPMTVTKTQRIAGSITQNITGDGTTTTTVTRQ